MPVVLITDSDYGDADVEAPVLRAAGFALERAACWTEDDVIAALRASGAVGALVQYAPVTGAVLAAAPRLRAVCRYGVGLDTIDTDAAAAAGVVVLNVPDYAAHVVADHAVALLLALLRDLPGWSGETRAGRWPGPRDRPAPRDLRETVVGLLGLGRIARAVAARLRAFDATVIAHDPFAAEAEAGVELVGAEELWARSHAVSLHAPLTEATRGCVDRAALAALPAGAVLVNTARAELVDRDALAEAVAAGRLRAGLDVWWEEPPPRDDPLLRDGGVLLTPHVAFLAEGSLERLRRLAAERLGEALRDVSR